ncbi:MAG: PHP domain-containing protein, partial [Pseudomonadota bacterium]
MVVELVSTTNFTFLTGASHPEEMVERAAEMGLQAIGITDRMSLAGVVRAHVRLKEIAREEVTRKDPNITGRDVIAHAKRIRSQTRTDPSSRLEEPLPETAEPEPKTYRSLPKLLIGSRLSFADAPFELVVLAPDRQAYARLSRLLTLGKRRAEKGGCTLYLSDLETWGEGLAALLFTADPFTSPAYGPSPSEAEGRGGGRTINPLGSWTKKLSSLHLAMTPAYDGRDTERFVARAQEAERLGLPLAATADPLMHRGARRRLADILTCIRERCTVETLGTRALPNAERRLRGPEEFARLFSSHPEAIENAQEIAAACAFSLDELAYEYPDEIVAGEPPQARLERLAREGLDWRYPDGVPETSRALVERELALIGKLNYAPYFLTVHDIVAFARSRGILAQGRGSAANSVTCYALGITEIAPERITMV